MRNLLMVSLVAAGVLAASASAEAQQQNQRQGARNAGDSATVTLVYEREVYTYAGTSRRDPFRPLTGDNEMGPRFESLALQGIVYSTGQGQSVALLSDGSGRVYRVRVGDVIGNSTVVEIGPLRVVMAVENFGSIRQEMLELRENQGADR